MKKAWILVGFLFGSSLFTNCNNASTNVEIPPKNFSTSKKPLTSTQLVWGGHFNVDNSGRYEDLLVACRRCGTKRVIQNPYGGGVTYQKFWVPDSHPKECQNWRSTGYMQVEFAELKLPTKATVSFQPKYSHSSNEYWGQPFAVKGEARAINENEGFAITLTPSSGLGGNRNLYILSSGTQHLNRGELDVEIIYGQNNEDATDSIFIQTLSPQSQKPISHAPFTCGQYTN